MCVCVSWRMAEAGEQVRNPAAAGEGPRKGDSEEGRESSVPEDEQQGTSCGQQ